jgi:hypothetical protein
MVSPAGEELMRVVLTSFRDSVNWAGPKFSTARWQPKGFKYPELPFLAPWDPDNGRKMVHLEPGVFREKYERLLERNAGEIRAFFEQRNDEQIVLCCWCHPRRQRGYERLYCHTILLGYWIERNLGLDVVMADGRDKPVWRNQ